MPDNLIIIKKLSQKLIWRITIEALVQNNIFSFISIAFLMALYIIALSIRFGSSMQFTESINVFKQECNQWTINGANKKPQKLELSYINYQSY